LHVLQVAEYRIPRYVRFVKDFERTVIGKVQKHRLLEQLQQELDTENSNGHNGKSSKTQVPTGLFKPVKISGKVPAEIEREVV
jgi:hypothetical protein